MSERPPLFVTRTYLPPLDDFLLYIESVFKSRQLTNQADLVRELEARLGDFLGLERVFACANGTLALMMGLRLAGLSGKKIVTTPFTYVATLSAIMWEGCTPVFADVEPDGLCMSPDSLRECLQRHPDAAGVVPVHVFGNACDVRAIDAICAEHELICLYDACHAFASSCEGRSLLDFGDYAVCSFHATKLFHCAEGGCLIVHNDQDARKAQLLRAFGHLGDDHFTLGFNAKLSELHAAMGLAILPQVPELIAARRKLCRLYDELLSKDCLARPQRRPGLEYNYAYYPVIFASEAQLLAALRALNAEGIYPRRYFYPSLSALPYLPQPAREGLCPVADDIAVRIACLPLAPDMSMEEMARVCKALNNFFES